MATVPIGRCGVDGASFDPASGNAFASNADATLTVIHQGTPDSYHVLENVQMLAGARIWGSIQPTTVCSWSRRSLDPCRRARLREPERRWFRAPSR
jgi:hypothetical protein